MRAYLGDPSSKFNKEGSFKLSFVVGIGLGLAFVAGPFSNVRIRFLMLLFRPADSNPTHQILTTRFGIRAPVALGVVLITVAMELASISTKYWHLFLSQGVMWGLGASLIFIPSIGLPSQYFSKRRGLATGLASVRLSRTLFPFLFTQDVKADNSGTRAGRLGNWYASPFAITAKSD